MDDVGRQGFITAAAVAAVLAFIFIGLVVGARLEADSWISSCVASCWPDEPDSGALRWRACRCGGGE